MSIDGLAAGQNNPYAAAARQDAARERIRAENQSAQRAPPKQDEPEPRSEQVRELRV